MEKVKVYTSFYSFCENYKSKLDCGYIEEFEKFLKEKADVDIDRTIKYLELCKNGLNNNDFGSYIRWSIEDLDSNKLRKSIMSEHKSETRWYGIYTIHGVKNNCIELIYVGMSGKDGKQKQDVKDGKQKQDVFGRICNTRSGGKSAKETYEKYVKEYDYLVFNFSVYDYKHFDSLRGKDITPKFMESAFISFYFCRTKEFPKYNKDLLG
jgi:hypothetical protein